MTLQPNILFIIADQFTARYMRCSGHRQVRTPNLDRLADEGVIFDAAYCNTPICAPSRASLSTGRMVSAIGAYDNGTVYPASTPTWMHQLRRANYEVLLSGKMHALGPDQLHGFERRLTPDICPASFIWTPDWRLGPIPNPGASVEQLHTTAGLCRWSLQLDYDEEVAFRSLEALRALARRPKDARPFSLCASFTHPHEPFVITREWWDLYDDDQIEMPTVGPEPFDRLHPYNQWLNIHHMLDTCPPSPEEIRRARHAYYGMISYFDSKVGQLVGELERLGLAENTIVVVTADHGEMLGEHGMWFKRTFYDPSTRVPLIAWNPRHLASHKRVAAAVSLVDLFPTFVDMAGLDDRDEVCSAVDGHSLLPFMRGEKGDHPEYALCEYCSEGAIQPMRMVVRDNLKYVEVHDHQSVLFDLARDPHEQADVIADPTYADRIGHLRKLLSANWDPVALRKLILESQRNRKWINQANLHGTRYLWDQQPDFDARRQYVRERDAQVLNAEQCLY